MNMWCVLPWLIKKNPLIIHTKLKYRLRHSVSSSILIKYKLWPKRLWPKWFVVETYYGWTGVWPKRLESHSLTYHASWEGNKTHNNQIFTSLHSTGKTIKHWKSMSYTMKIPDLSFYLRKGPIKNEFVQEISQKVSGTS